MGYMSDVLITGRMEPAVLKKHIALLALTEPWFKYIVEEIERGNFSISFTRGAFFYKEIGVKFYDTFDEVKALRAFYSYFEELAESRPWNGLAYDELTKGIAPEDNYYSIDLVFIRIGEDQEDVEKNHVNAGYDLAWTEVVIQDDTPFTENEYGCGNCDDKCQGEAGDQVPVLRGPRDADENDTPDGDSNGDDGREDHLLQSAVDQRP
jgi:hypothetical protein